MLIATLLILTLGIAVIFSSSQVLAIQQALYGIVGIICYFFLKFFDYRSITPLIKYAYIAACILLLITLFLGFESRGSIRWISLGWVNIQPSELAKPVIILTLAYFWKRHLPTWRNIFLSFLFISPIFIMIFRQPDLGTALTILFIWGVMLIASNLTLGKAALLISTLLITIPSSWFFLHDYQKQRIISFLSPESDPQGIGFHVIQSTIAVGSGQLWGRGLGRGTQSRLQFLPEFRTDFIFAFIAEELGMIGSLMVLLLYSTIFYFCIRYLNRAGERFGELIIVGVMAMMFFQIVVNIGMNIGILPITGITLPLLSYGGSSLISTLICLGLVASVAKFGLRKKEVSTIGI